MRILEDHDHPITLTATASAGSMFAGWTDATCSAYGTSPCQLTLTAATTVTAAFAVIPSYLLSVSVAGSGTVTSTPSGINCSPSCLASFQSGKQITLTASANSGSTFAGWGGACSGSGSCQVTIRAGTSVSATFNSPLASGNGCNGTYDGPFSGNITVTPGQSCTFTSSPLAPSQISGNVTVNGGSLGLLGGQVNGNVQVTGASSVSVAGATIGGNLQIQKLAAGLPQGTVCGTQVKGNLLMQSNASPLAFGANNTQTCGGNAVTGNLQANDNSAALAIDNDTVGGDLQAQNNTAALSIDHDWVGGNLQVQNNTGGVDVSSNQVRENLQCQNNNPVPTNFSPNMVGGNNQGQCALQQ
jgi:Divergent InlB B-repeat domain